MVKIKPCGKRVLIRYHKAEEKVGSLYIPDDAKEKPMQAEVIDVGIELEPCKTPIKVGDTVLVHKYAGIDIPVDEQIYSIVEEEAILAIVIDAPDNKQDSIVTYPLKGRI